MNSYNCIFTGGSTRGLCYVGVLKAFEELGISIDYHIGSSIGALIITFYALGYSAKEIENEIDNLNMPALFRDFNFNILSDFAFSKGDIYLNWLREKIERKFYGKDYKKDKIKPVCFKDVDKDIIVIATNLLDSSIIIFSKEITPDFEIAQALRASSSMPGLLKPYKYGDKILIDGDILRGRPIWKLIPEINTHKDRILEFRITGGNVNKLSKNPVKLVNSIINAAAYTIDNDAVKTYKDDINIIQIDVPDVDFTDFKFSLKKKKHIYNIGYEVIKNTCHFAQNFKIRKK